MANLDDPRSHEQQPPFGEQQQPYPGHTEAMQPTPDHGERSYRGLGRLEGKVALITGGDSGIGRATAIAFAREGADVAIAYLGDAEEEDARETARWIRDAGREGFTQAADLSQRSACQELVDEVVDHFGRIDVLVNNAAYQGDAVQRFEDLDPERVSRAFAINIEAMFHITRRALPHMQSGSVIINTSSIQGYEPSPPILDYATTKSAIVNFTRGLSKELIDRGIRVNSVAPGPVWTPLIPQSFHEEKVDRFGENNPMSRPAQPAELAPSYVFLANDESRFITGEVLGVTGGRRLA